MYILCGLGPLCSIQESQPTTDRAALLRREALELALYTFRYVEDVDSVLVLLPPATEARPRPPLHSALRRPGGARQPLRETLTATTTPGVGEMTPTEARTVSRHAGPPLLVRPLQAQDGSPCLILTPAIAEPRMHEELAAALARAKARLDRLDYYPAPVRLERVRVHRLALVLPASEDRRYTGYTLWRTILFKQPSPSDDLVTHELCHIWQMQHRPWHVTFKHLTTRYRGSPYEIEARHAVAETR